MLHSSRMLTLAITSMYHIFWSHNICLIFQSLFGTICFVNQARLSVSYYLTSFLCWKEEGWAVLCCDTWARDRRSRPNTSGHVILAIAGAFCVCVCGIKSVCFIKHPKESFQLSLRRLNNILRQNMLFFLCYLSVFVPQPHQTIQYCHNRKPKSKET